MKVLVSNLSGNVGKTLTAKYLLSPRMGNAPIYSVESINSDGSESDLIRGKQYGELLEALSLVEDAVVDVGASNIEEFIKLMKQYRGSHEDFDFIVIPTVGSTKQMRDTIATIEALSEIGIPAKKLRVVFNMIDIDETPERVFSGLFSYHEKEHKFTLRQNAVIRFNELYEKIKGDNRTIEDIITDQTDLKEKIKLATTQDEKLDISREIGIKRLAAGVSEELDYVFKALFK